MHGVPCSTANVGWVKHLLKLFNNEVGLGRPPQLNFLRRVSFFIRATFCNSQLIKPERTAGLPGWSMRQRGYFPATAHFMFDLTCDVTCDSRVTFFSFIWKISSRALHCRLNFSGTSIGYRDSTGAAIPPPPPPQQRAGVGLGPAGRRLKIARRTNP